MSETPTIVIDFSQEQKEQDCPLLYVEVPQGEISPGDELEIRLWGPEELLGGWNLCAAHESLGPGRLGGLTAQEALFSQQLDLAAATVVPLEYPFVQAVSVTALTPLVWVDPAAPCPPRVWQPKGRNLLSKSSRKGYSCLEFRHDAPLYGSVLATVRRVASFRRWTWTMPANFRGDLWFFLYDDLETEPYRIFSIEMPELAATSVEYKALSILVQDFATEAAIPGARIYLDGNLAGSTDEDGLLHLSGVATGEHSFRAEKDGYLDTDADGLSNDRIVVK